MSARLSGLTIGALTLTPSFDPDTTEYTAETENATNKITATPESETATVAIFVNGTELEGDVATWVDNSVNEVEIMVVDGTLEKHYIVAVTKGTPE